MDIGSAVGRAAGIEEAQLRDLVRFEESTAFSEVEKLVLRLADAMTHTPVEVPSDLVAALRTHLDDGALVELVTAIAWENFRARFNRAFDVQAQGFSEGAYCVLPGQRAR